MSAFGTKRTSHRRFAMSAFGGKADMAGAAAGSTRSRMTQSGHGSGALGCNERSARNHDDHREDFNQKLVVHWRTFGTSSAQKQRFLAR
jgi:hypothetical protein